MTPTTCQTLLFAVTVCLLGSLLLPSSADATVMRYADLARLVETSHIVVKGTVQDLNTRTESDGTMWTEIHVDVAQVYMGEVGGELVFEQWGGEDRGRQARIPGDARLERGQEVVLFLIRDENSPRIALTALSQSVYEIRRDASGNRLVYRDLGDLSFLMPTEEGSRIVHHRDPPHDWYAFESILQEIIEARQVELEGLQ